METPIGLSHRLGDRSTSDVVVRIRTQEGRDNWIHGHSQILVEKSKYFADRLSESWPTCQIIDSRSCVEVHCEEADFDHYINLLRLFYVTEDGSMDDNWYGVKNALGILRVAVKLGCPKVVIACVNYLEAMPWEEAEEEEILKMIPSLGLQAEPILSRLQPVNSEAVRRIFISAIQFATSSPPSSMNDLKSSAQEQLEYMLTEDDDAPLLVADEEIKYDVRGCTNQLFARFSNLLELCLCGSAGSISKEDNMQSFESYLSDVSWACQILNKLESMKELAHSWVDASEKIIQVVELTSSTTEMAKAKDMVIQVAAKVLEAIACGTVILPSPKRLDMVKLWLPFVRIARILLDAIPTEGEDASELRTDAETWQSLELSFVYIILTLPSQNQAEILTEWLESNHAHYPDLTEAFEVWCYRSKAAKKRLKQVFDSNDIENMV